MTALQHIAIEAEAPAEHTKAIAGTFVASRAPHQSPAKLLHQVIQNNDNDDATSRHYALDALTDNRAAFWIAREGSQMQTANCVMRTACRLGSLALALEDEICAMTRSVFPRRLLETLDVLIPLNGQAVVQLMDAYEQAGTFRNRLELVARRDRVSPLVREFAA